MNKNSKSFQNLSNTNKNAIKTLFQKEIEKYFRPYDIFVKKSFHYIQDIEIGKKSLNYIKIIYSPDSYFIYLLEHLYAFCINIEYFLNKYKCNATFNSSEGLLICDIDKHSDFYNFCIYYSDFLFEHNFYKKNNYTENKYDIQLVLSIHLIDVSEEYYHTFLDF